VLWKAGSTTTAAAAAGPVEGSSGECWQCFENACPHRCGTCRIASAISR
jgi:hypothetical protein